MTKFTPGPWIRDGLCIYALDEKGSSENQFCVELQAHSCGVEGVELEANARLIQHAPYLFAALNALLGGNEKMDVTIGGNPEYVKQFLARTRFVIDEIE